MADRIYDWRRVLWLCLPVVPLGCLVWEAVLWSSFGVNYPSHFNDKCTQFGEVYYRGATTVTGLLIENAIWLSPAIFLIFLWNKRYVVVFYAFICLPFWTFIHEGVVGILARSVSCTRDIGLGDAMMGLALFIQTFMLLVFSLIVCGVLVIGRLRGSRPVQTLTQ